jgi:hypothetical protein
MLTHIPVTVYCFIANTQGHYFIYSPQQALEFHRVIIMLLSYGNEHLWSDYCHTFQNFMEKPRNCTHEEMTD